MPIIRNPFRKNVFSNSSESVVSTLDAPGLQSGGRFPASESHLGIPDEVTQRHPTASKSTSAITITKDPPEGYKLSVVNDSGVYLPPSPPEKKSFWRKSTRLTNPSTDGEPAVEEPFTISRESFESYRRSFDISARSPVMDGFPSRTSLDSRPLPSRISLDSRSPRTMPRVLTNVEEPPEDTFEDIKLNDDAVRPKRRSLFSRFGTESTIGENSSTGPKIGRFGKKEYSNGLPESELRRLDAAVAKEG
ncbi:Pumilio y domain member 6 [Rhizina undulata]